jgi:hypothetical protein
MMSSAKVQTGRLEDPRIYVKQKLAALWTAVMFCFIYADILAFYDPWLLEEIGKGNMGPLGPITQKLKLAVAVWMSIPAIMIFLSLTLKATINRIANAVTGSLFTLVTVATFIMGPSAYYVYFGLLEILLTSLIVLSALQWPREEAGT